MMIFFSMRARQETVLDQTYTFQPLVAGEKSFVTKPFELHGTSANLEVDVTGQNLQNSWAFISMALINEETGQAYDFGRQISYYSGVDDGESWSEDNRNDSATLPSIPGGKYYLRIEPETEAPAAGSPSMAMNPIRYSVKLVRDVPFYFRYFLGVFLLLLPLPFLGRKGANFEQLRWTESDYGVTPNSVIWSSKSSSGEDDDE